MRLFHDLKIVATNTKNHLGPPQRRINQRVTIIVTEERANQS